MTRQTRNSSTDSKDLLETAVGVLGGVKNLIECVNQARGTRYAPTEFYMWRKGKSVPREIQEILRRKILTHELGDTKGNELADRLQHSADRL